MNETRGEQPVAERRHLWTIAIWMFVAVSFFLGAVVGVFYWIERVQNRVEDFYALWHTTDTISHFVSEHGEWPSNWGALEESWKEAYPTAEMSAARDRIEVNFSFHLRNAPPDEWCVRVKSGSYPMEETTANGRLLPSARGLSRVRQ
jgi:hypothetical protein